MSNPNAHVKTTFDPGLTQQYTGALNRAVNENGEFNVRRRGGTFRDGHPYLFLVSISWPAFLAIVVAIFITANLFFASLYIAIGTDHLKGVEAGIGGSKFWTAFFFSTHTLTTVGYGSIYPVGAAANALAAIEALVGLLAIALATGLLFGRFARPSARIGFSTRMLVAPFNDGLSLQFRIVNRRTNNLLDLSARVLMMTVESVDGNLRRKFTQLDLERDQIIFFPLTWTVVHPITESSPLFGKTSAELATLQTEILIIVKAFDETFGQTVNTRRSYRHDEIVWGARFKPAFTVDTRGDLRVEVDEVSTFEPTEQSLERLT